VAPASLANRLVGFELGLHGRGFSEKTIAKLADPDEPRGSHSHQNQRGLETAGHGQQQGRDAQQAAGPVEQQNSLSVR